MSVSESLEDREENRIFDVCPLVCIQATLVLVHKTFFQESSILSSSNDATKKADFWEKGISTITLKQ